jgi:carbonyl reductase 1
MKNPLLALVILLMFAMPSAAALSSKLLQGKRVALVTGANKGIGKEIARKLCRSDEDIITILACRTNGEKTAKELGCDHHCYLELTDDQSIEDCAKYVEETFGQLDILVNNAAICFNDPTLYGKVSYTPFEKQAAITIQTNFFGTYKLTNRLLPLLQRSSSSNRQQPARIINIASAAGRLGILKSQEKRDMFTDPDLTTQKLEQHMNDFVKAVETGVYEQQGWARTCYGMSKLGLIAFTKIMARDHPNLLVNSVDPGYCATDQNDNQGNRPVERGAVTPYLLATTESQCSGDHWFDEKVIPWSYS